MTAVTAVPRRSSLSIPQNRAASTGGASGAAPPNAQPPVPGMSGMGAPNRRVSRGASITEVYEEEEEEEEEAK